MIDDLNPIELGRIEKTTQELGRYLFARSALRRPSPLERRWWDDRLMQWAMRDEAVKVQMFRFIDVLPTLRSNRAILEHLQDYFGDVRSRLPAAARLGLALARPGLPISTAVAQAARRNAEVNARRFIAGANLAEVLEAARRERRQRRAFTLDILGEAVTSDAEAERYFNAYVALIQGIAPTVNAWPESPQIDRSIFAELPRVNVSLKLSALDSRYDPIDPAGTAARVAPRLRALLRIAQAQRAHLHVDMEAYATKDLTLDIFKQVLMEDEFRKLTDVGVVIQCYLHDAGRDLLALRDWVAQRGAPIWVRLVKGAYWDYETIRARSEGWPIPVFSHKAETDANFERQSRFLLRNWRLLRPAIASHNLRSIAHAIAVARHVGVPHSGFELQMLYGMADDEKQALVRDGYRLRIYMPYGELLPGMAYLVRRLLENTSNESFLRASSSEHAPIERLLMNPLHHTHPENGHPAPAPLPPAAPAAGHPFAQAFHNEPLADFAQAEPRRLMRAALARVRGQLGAAYSLWLGGAPRGAGESLASINPSHRREIIGRVAAAGTAEVNAAVAVAQRAAPAWNALGAGPRAEFLRRAAGSLRRHRFELAAWIVLECGKGWREADGDVCEAIDFCEFYADGALALAGPQGVDVPGEENRFEYWPRGVAAVIAPWNFPLAILTGMTAAALATGNTVIMKPAEQSPVIAAKLMELFNQLGLPPGVLSYLPGAGEVVGAGLVEHPHVNLIAFTGSRAVGLAINARAAQVSTKLKNVKRVIAEMGGKNAIIIDDDADLDEAVLGVVKSAFGYQGQKCSACSRAIVLDSIHDEFLGRLVEASRSLEVGPAEDPASSIGPLIDAESLRRVREYIALGRQTAREVLATDVGSLAEEGFYVGPHIFADVAPDSRLAQEEIFGPVLAVMRAKSFDEAIRIFNDTDYALTGGVFSRRPEHLARARRELVAGNVYLNRGITGALVSRQPFGGFKMSGIGSKAGGQDYLLQFVVPRTITENTMRRGFAPNVE